MKEFRPFEDPEEIEKIKQKRDELIMQLENFYDIPEDEKRFLMRRISIISNKLLEKARYAKDI